MSSVPHTRLSKKLGKVKLGALSPTLWQGIGADRHHVKGWRAWDLREGAGQLALSRWQGYYVLLERANRHHLRHHLWHHVEGRRAHWKIWHRACQCRLRVLSSNSFLAGENSEHQGASCTACLQQRCCVPRHAIYAEYAVPSPNSFHRVQDIPPLDGTRTDPLHKECSAWPIQ